MVVKLLEVFEMFHNYICPYSSANSIIYSINFSSRHIYFDVFRKSTIDNGIEKTVCHNRN